MVVPNPAGDFDKVVDSAQHALTDDWVLLVLDSGSVWHVSWALASNGVRETHQSDVVHQGCDLHASNDFGRHAGSLAEPGGQACHITTAVCAFGDTSFEEADQ